ncbi:glycosyltransferase [Cohnella abietis]|uniref:4,4'-diaponeurosporenoate glycosyltransferase n=1 Tax=Cohnella abietis TaxID=2507935 RepID=A0A3T1D6B8_9BACL|nr:glycosyltransferase family 2 protein [Cohnella abietis]BBI33628.1 glycosyl transferase [Cohnella abietis]
MILTWLIVLVGWLCGWQLLLANKTLRFTSKQQIHQPFARPSLSIIVPARNEASNIGNLMRSLRGQLGPNDEIIVVNDGSVDDTGIIAEAWGARVVATKRIPIGWQGKSWACWNGVQASSGEMLLFIDADAQMAPNGINSIVFEYLSVQGCGKGILTMQPYHLMKNAYEKLSLYFNLIVLGAIASAGRKSGGFGPVALCLREEYDDVGGHAGVSGFILEHYELARRYASMGYPVRNRYGEGVVTFRMYPSGFLSLVRGWSKGFATGAGTSSVRTLLIIIPWIAGSLTAFTSLINHLVNGSWIGNLAGTAIYMSYAIQLYLLQQRAGNFGYRTVVLYPLALMTFLWAFIQSLISTFFVRRVEWKGRTLALKEKGKRA